MHIIRSISLSFAALLTIHSILSHFSCHVFRHTFATRLIEAGVKIKVIQAFLGHTDITTTMDIYIDVTNKLKTDEIVKFEQYLKDGKQRLQLFNLDQVSNLSFD